MLSFGIEFSRAFSIAFWRAMLPPGSGPPSRAATMIARVSFEKSWPRFASVAPFFRLIDAHLLCPDKARLPHRLEKELVHARVVRELGVEGSDQEPALPEEHGLAVELCQHLDAVARAGHAGRPDEHASEGRVIPRQVEVGLEAEHLAAVAVARDLEVDEAEVVAVEDDQSRAGAEHGLLEAPNRILEPVEPHQAHERRRLAARDDEPVKARELLRLAHLDRLRTEPPQHRRVLAEVSLHSEDSDPHPAHSRFGLEELCSRDLTVAPTRDQQPDPDEDGAQDDVGEGRGPRVGLALLAELLLVAEEREQHEAEREIRVPENTDVRPLLGEMRRHLQEAPGGEHDPARTHQPVAERDVQHC